MIDVQHHTGNESVRFAANVVLTKHEAFEVCELYAEAERMWLRAGRAVEAARAAALFELVESRLTLD
jgi:hypothetical protein